MGLTKLSLKRPVSVIVVIAAIIVFGVFFYLPFLKVAERVALKNSGTEN